MEVRLDIPDIGRHRHGGDGDLISLDGAMSPRESSRTGIQGYMRREPDGAIRHRRDNSTIEIGRECAMSVGVNTHVAIVTVVGRQGTPSAQQ